MIHVNEEATFVSAPIAAWPGSHVHIVINAKKKISATKCMDEANSRLKFFDHYDSTGGFCMAELVMDHLTPYIGCHMPGYGYTPNSSVACDVSLFPMMGKANSLDLDMSLLASLAKGDSDKETFVSTDPFMVWETPKV